MNWNDLSDDIKIKLMLLAMMALAMAFLATDARCEDVQRVVCEGRAYVAVEHYNSCVRDHNRAIDLGKKCHRDCADELAKAKAGIIDASAEIQAQKKRAFFDGFSVGGVSGMALVVLIVLLL